MNSYDEIREKLDSLLTTTDPVGVYDKLRNEVYALTLYHKEQFEKADILLKYLCNGHVGMTEQEKEQSRHVLADIVLPNDNDWEIKDGSTNNPTKSHHYYIGDCGEPTTVDLRKKEDLPIIDSFNGLDGLDGLNGLDGKSFDEDIENEFYGEQFEKRWEVEIEEVSDGPDSEFRETIVSVPDDFIETASITDNIIFLVQQDSESFTLEKFTPATGMSWAIPIEEVRDQNGRVERIMSLPEGFLKEAKWKAGDKVWFNSNYDGTYDVKKATKKELDDYLVTKASKDEERLKRREMM